MAAFKASRVSDLFMFGLLLWVSVRVARLECTLNVECFTKILWVFEGVSWVSAWVSVFGA